MTSSNRYFPYIGTGSAKLLTIVQIRNGNNPMRRTHTKKFIIVILGLLFTASSTLTLSSLYSAQQPAMDWKNVCDGPDSTSVSYCRNVGKDAYNATGAAVLRDVKLGGIIGVCWRPASSIIGYSPPIPAANIPAEYRRSPRDAYYYIIDDGTKDDAGKPKPFLRQCREIEAKNPIYP